MEKAGLTTQSRANLDGRFKEFGAVRRYTAPVRGWTKAVREALMWVLNQTIPNAQEATQ